MKRAIQKNHFGGQILYRSPTLFKKNDVIHTLNFTEKIIPKFQSDQEDVRAITEEQGQLLAVQHGIDFIECSALSGENVREAFFRMARRVKIKHESKKGSTPKRNNVQILSDPGPSTLGSKFSNCC